MAESNELRIGTVLVGHKTVTGENEEWGPRLDEGIKVAIEEALLDWPGYTLEVVGSGKDADYYATDRSEECPDICRLKVSALYGGSFGTWELTVTVVD